MTTCATTFHCFIDFTGVSSDSKYSTGGANGRREVVFS